MAAEKPKEPAALRPEAVLAARYRYARFCAARREHSGVRCASFQRMQVAPRKRRRSGLLR